MRLIALSGQTVVATQGPRSRKNKIVVTKINDAGEAIPSLEILKSRRPERGWIRKYKGWDGYHRRHGLFVCHVRVSVPYIRP